MANAAAQSVLGLPAGVEGREAGKALAGAPAVAELAERALRKPSEGTPTVVRVGEGERVRALAVEWAPVPDETGGGVILWLDEVGEAGRGERGQATLRGIGRLTSHMAHELKNPLGALKLYALLLSRQMREGQEQARELAEKIARAVDQLSTEVSSLSAFGPAATLEATTISLTAVADGCLAAVDTDAAARGIQLVRRYEASPTVRADARALQRAVLAFVQNGLEAMTSGGTLTVAVAGAGSPEAEVAIQDTGAGMPPQVQVRLFEPFFTTKPDGIGLGMALARQTVEQHGGRVEVSSQPGAGTTVRVVLPGQRQAGDDGRGTHPSH
jgi:two-component system sensor histidine kinase TtrS